MAAENIKTEYYLWFDRNSLIDYVVTVVEENAVERPLRYRFTLEIKKAYIERAYLPIPIQFWHSHVVNEFEDLSRCLLISEDIPYEVEFVAWHGKVLMQNMQARDFVDFTGIFEDWLLTKRMMHESLSCYGCPKMWLGKEGLFWRPGLMDVFSAVSSNIHLPILVLDHRLQLLLH
ncbi:chromosomal replication initiator protein DnaA [Striga asiatica]|uniref:Chromosomal replication initiator protein DnaA n=1 Tax=Striga asiatica TaxID=4170 RepID=A0A5A7Q2Y8_STRAF|nr:chromosomal replication initiator protein DnaA [Striga asiatica]